MAKETGLICTGESVRAFLDNRKSQTRRVVIPQPTFLDGGELDKHWYWEITHSDYYECEDKNRLEVDLLEYCKRKYGQVGDRLWVRETWDFRPMGGELAANRIAIIGYKVDGATKAVYVPQGYNPTIHRKWRSSRFMPKWAARIWRENVSIGVEKMEGEYYLYADEILESGIITTRKIIDPWVWVLEVKEISDG